MAEIIARDVDFNWDDDRKEFDTADKVVRMYGFRSGGYPEITLTFELGRKEDDTMNFTFRLCDLLSSICEEMANLED